MFLLEQGILQISLRFQDERVGQQVRPGQTPLRVLLQQPLQERFEFTVHVGRVLDRILDNVVDQGVNRVGVEGRLSDQKLVKNYTEGPQIRRVICAALLLVVRIATSTLIRASLTVRLLFD